MINIRTLQKLQNNDGLTLKNGKIIEYKTGWQVATEGVEITDIKLDYDNLNRGIELRVTDPELLNLTGGIIQGMSGSPIIQDGKFVGAVTHVLVNDPTRGYGIFIEEMLEH